MEQDLKYKIGTTISIGRQQVLDFFSPYIDSQVEGAANETYSCRDGSLLILAPASVKESVFVQFHLNLIADPQNPERDPEGKTWFMQCCKQYGSEIKNLRSAEILPVSDGAIMSDLFSSKFFRVAITSITTPKTSKLKESTNLKFSRKIQMSYIDKSVVPYCFVTVKFFEWGEDYNEYLPIFNLCADPGLSDLAFTIEILGLNNFKASLFHLYNILLNREEYERISEPIEPVSNREQLLARIDHFQQQNTGHEAPWDKYMDILDESWYLEKIEAELNRTLLYGR